MTESRAARPPLATIICIYLLVTAFIPLPARWIYLFGWFHSIFIYHSTLPHTPLPLAIGVLAIAGAIALWQMRRAAFVLLAIRLVLSLLVMVINLPRSLALYHRLSTILGSALADSLEARGILAVIVAQWLLGALIVWYVYRITLHQHVSTELAGPEPAT